MIYKLILVCLLATSAAFASSIKGARDEYSAKGERVLSSPVEYQRQRQLQQAEPSKTSRDEPVQQEQQRELSKTQERDEQRREPSKTSAPVAETEQRREEQVQLVQYQEQQKLVEEYQPQQQREEAPVLTQQREEAPAPPTKTLRYEARPQVPEEAAAKGQKAVEFQKVEAQREEGLKTSKLAEPVRQEQQKTVEEPKAVVYEQQRETFYDQQQQQQQVEVKEYDQQRRLEDQQGQYAQVQYQQQEEQQRVSGGVKGAAPQAPVQVAEPEPYSFDYSVEGSSRRESGDTNGVVRGQYTLQNPDGSSRIVDYVADRDGFRASVNTNEFGTESGSPANVELRSSQPAAQDISLRLEGKTREFLNPPPAAPVAAVKSAAPQPPARADNWNVKGGQQQQQQQQVAYIEEIRNTKSAAPVQQQQQQVVYAEEVRATKGAAKSEQQYEQVKAPVQPVQRSPAKGSVQRLETVESASPVEAPAVVKSAELRTPKAIGAELRPASSAPVAPRLRAGFESATAHRPVIGVPRNQIVQPVQYVGGPGVAHPQRHASPPSTIVRHYQPGQAPIVRTQYNRPQPVASVLRSQLQHDRYPPNPIYNYNTRGERPVNPRVSFYGTNAEINEETPVGFGESS